MQKQKFTPPFLRPFVALIFADLKQIHQSSYFNNAIWIVSFQCFTSPCLSFHVNKCVCFCLCTNIYICIFKGLCLCYICLCMCLYVFASVFAPISVCMCICSCFKIQTSVFPCVYICVCVCVCTLSLSVKPALRLPRPEMTDRVGCSAGDRGRERKTFLRRNCI